MYKQSVKLESCVPTRRRRSMVQSTIGMASNLILSNSRRGWVVCICKGHSWQGVGSSTAALADFAMNAEENANLVDGRFWISRQARASQSFHQFVVLLSPTRREQPGHLKTELEALMMSINSFALLRCSLTSWKNSKPVMHRWSSVRGISKREMLNVRPAMILISSASWCLTAIVNAAKGSK